MSVLNGHFVINDGQPVAGNLELRYDYIDVTTQYERDPNWTFVDKNGHFHAVDTDGEMPTLVAKEKHVPCDGSCGGVCDGEGYGKTVYRCVICNAKVKPGIRPGTPRSIQGRSDHRLEVETHVPLDGVVSFRLVDGGGLVLFGTAQAYSHYSEGGPDGITNRTTLAVQRLGRGKRQPVRGPRLPHTHDPDGDGTDDCAACTVQDEAAAKRREDR